MTGSSSRAPSAHRGPCQAAVVARSLFVAARGPAAAIARAIRSASRPTPWIIVDENEYRKFNPTKYNPG